MKTNSVLSVMIWSVLAIQTVLLCADETQDRLDEMLVELAGMPENYSVTCSVVTLQESSKMSKQDPIIIETLFTKYRVKDEGFARIDLFDSYLASGNVDCWVHMLQHNNRLKVARGVGQRSKLWVREFKVGDAIPRNKWFDTDLRMLAISEWAGIAVNGGFDYHADLSSKLIPVASRIEDEKFALIGLSPSRTIAWKIAFGKSPRWAPIACQSYKVTDAPLGPNVDYFMELSKMKLVSETYTRWIQKSGELWVPVSTQLYFHPQSEQIGAAEVEVTFSDWKFDKEVVIDDIDSQLDRFSKSTLEEVSFSEMRDRHKDYIRRLGERGGYSQ